jgi:hypothetical protein
MVVGFVDGIRSREALFLYPIWLLFCRTVNQRKKDYQMSGQFESASGMTNIQVRRNWSTTIIAGAIIGILLIIIMLYVFRNVL